MKEKREIVKTKDTKPREPDEIAKTSSGITLFKEIEEKLLKVAITDKSFLLLLYKNYKISYFNNDINKEIVRVLYKFFNKYKFVPTKEVFLTIAKKILIKKFDEEKIDKIIEKINYIYDLEITPNEKDFIISEVDTIIKRQKMKEAILKSVSLLDKEDFDGIFSLIKEVVKFSTSVDKGYEITDNIEERYIKITDTNNVIPSFLNSLNLYMEGGFHRGELNIVMAASGYGKSTFLVNEAVYALKKDFNVLYITLELNENQIANRIDRCLWNKTSEEIREEWEELKEKYEMFKKTSEGKLFIYSAPSYTFSTSDIERLLEKLKNYDDFVPDIILVDYLELMQVSGRKRDYKEYERQGLIAGELRNLGIEHNCSIVTATQTNRKVFDLDKEDEGVAEQQVIGESLNKVKISDTFFLILATKKELEEDNMRFRIIKNRHGKNLIDIEMMFDFAKMKMEEKII